MIARLLDLALDAARVRRLLIQPEPAHEPTQRRQHDVRFHVHSERQSEPLAVLREVADPVPDGVRRAGDADGPTVNEDLARFGAVGPEDRPRDLGSAGADEAGEAENLALAELEADVADHPSPVEVADLQHDLVIGVPRESPAPPRRSSGRPSC